MATHAPPGLLRPAAPPKVAEAQDGSEDPSAGLYRLSLAQYHEMGRLGLLTKRDRVELLDGLLVRTMTKGARHVGVTILIGDALRARLGVGWHLRQEAPVSLPAPPGAFDGEPEPDLSVVRGRPSDYFDRHPGPGDVGLVVEVSETSLRLDRKKRAAYARAAVSAVWLVDLAGGAVEASSEPDGQGDYRRRQVFRTGEAVPLVLDGLEVGAFPVADFGLNPGP